MPEGGRTALDGAVDPDDLRPVFATRVRRTVQRLETTDHAGRPSLIEAALDVGGIEANGASLPIAEVELELLEGSPEALYALALELDALAPLRLETRSKSARGYALAAGRRPPGTKPSRRRSRRTRRSTGPFRPSCATACSTGAPTRPPPSTAAIPKACTRCGSRSAACARRSRCSAV